MIWQLFFTIIITIVAVIVVWQTWQGRRFGPYVPSNMKMLRRALQELSPTPADRFVDIGSGDGRAVIVAAKQFHLQADGIEISPVLCWWATVRTWLAGVRSRTKIICGDLYQLNLSNYSIIYIFGLPANIQTKVYEKLRRECKPGTHIISYSFSLPQQSPIKVLQDRWRKIMIYQLN